MLSIGILASKLPVFAAYKIPIPPPTLPANMLSACAGFARMVNKGFKVIVDKPLKLTDCCKYWTSDSGLEWDGMPKLTGEQLVAVSSKICRGIEPLYIILTISGVALTNCQPTYHLKLILVHLNPHYVLSCYIRFLRYLPVVNTTIRAYKQP